MYLYLYGHYHNLSLCVLSSKMDIVQQGLQMFILERVSKSTLHELCGFFAVTGSDGIRFFAFFRSFNSSVFVSVSSFPILNTVRELFDLLELEKPENVLPILNVLCELPIVPAAGAKYRLQLSHGSTIVKFNLADQVNDASMDVIILTVMTPLMLVRAWESIIMERKVLVVSSIDSIITACCEFIRRLALPLEVVNTYVPLLPPELINTIEAPFPYLLGANSDVVRDSAVDISETVIIDLVSITYPYICIQNISTRLFPLFYRMQGLLFDLKAKRQFQREHLLRQQWFPSLSMT